MKHPAASRALMDIRVPCPVRTQTTALSVTRPTLMVVQHKHTKLHIVVSRRSWQSNHTGKAGTALAGAPEKEHESVHSLEAH